VRDDFSLNTIKIMAARAGYRCSNPRCKQPTSGPRVDKTASVNIGVGAHITAASSGGPRFDSSLTSEQRRSVDNGIWLCQNCAKLIDNDEQRFSTSLLHAWKQRAEADALAELKAALETGRPRFATLERTLKGHTNYVWDVVVTPDGRRVLSASNDKTVKMWDLATGNLLATFSGHTSMVCSIAIAPDGIRLAAGAFDGSIKVWNINSGDVIADLHHGNLDAKVAWSPTDDALSSGGADGVLRVWDV
jgi:WD40 repeat protein